MEDLGILRPKEKGKRKRSESFVEDLIQTNVHYLEPSEAEQVDTQSVHDEMNGLKVEMAVESLSSLAILSRLSSKMINQEKIKSMVYSIQKKKKQYEKYSQTSEYTRKADKIYFVLGCLITYISFYMIGRYPGTYYFYWLVFLEIFLFTKRFLLYKSLKWHYFLIDFCYFCNLTLCIFLCMFPHSQILYLF